MPFFFKKNYPNTKVTLLFTLLGTLLSIFIVSFIFLIFVGLKKGWLEIFYLIIQGVCVFGFIPALITGLITALLQLTKNTDWVGFKCSIIGFVTTFIYVSILTLKINLMCVFIGGFGAISASIIVLIALPE